MTHVLTLTFPLCYRVGARRSKKHSVEFFWTKNEFTRQQESKAPAGQRVKPREAQRVSFAGKFTHLLCYQLKMMAGFTNKTPWPPFPRCHRPQVQDKPVANIPFNLLGDITKHQNNSLCMQLIQACYRCADISNFLIIQAGNPVGSAGNGTLPVAEM